MRLDRRFKAAVYAQAGLHEYWIVNLVDRVLEVHRIPQAEGTAGDWTYGSIDSLRAAASVTPLAAPTARIPVADLFQ